MKIVFHGSNAFSVGFADFLEMPAEILALPDNLDTEEMRGHVADADVLIGFRFNAKTPKPRKLSLYHVPGAGYDGIDTGLLPSSAILCNCFEHEGAIAEYVMAGILAFNVPLREADAQMRQGDWSLRSGAPAAIHGEIDGKTIGLLGFGHIGQAVAKRAKAFGMRVHVAGRRALPPSDLVDQSFSLSALDDFWRSADIFVISVPLEENTRNIVDAAAFAAMRPDALLVNVGRGATVDEKALYDALAEKKIAGAVIDTWYNYPPHGSTGFPSQYPIHTLPNVIMTPHMSGWTSGVIKKRQRVLAENIRRRARGEPCLNVVWQGGG